MQTIQAILFLFTMTHCLGQGSVVGLYKNRISEKIELKADGTFTYWYRFHLSSSWTTGIWEMEKDTLCLKPILIMDTLSIPDRHHELIRDSLVLSPDLSSNRITHSDFLAAALSSGGQNRVKPPDRLLVRRNRLFRIDANGQPKPGTKARRKSVFKKE